MPSVAWDDATTLRMAILLAYDLGGPGKQNFKSVAEKLGDGFTMSSVNWDESSTLRFVTLIACNLGGPKRKDFASIAEQMGNGVTVKALDTLWQYNSILSKRCPNKTFTMPNAWTPENEKRFLVYMAYLGGTPNQKFPAILEKMGPGFTINSLSCKWQRIKAEVEKEGGPVIANKETSGTPKRSGGAGKMAGRKRTGDGYEESPTPKKPKGGKNVKTKVEYDEEVEDDEKVKADSGNEAFGVKLEDEGVEDEA